MTSSSGGKRSIQLSYGRSSPQLSQSGAGASVASFDPPAHISRSGTVVECPGSMLNPITHRRVLRHGIPARARILEMKVPSSATSTLSVPMRIEVLVEGSEPRQVEGHWWVKVRDVPALQGTIPVRVDAGDHQKVALDWEAIRAAYERWSAARRDGVNGDDS